MRKIVYSVPLKIIVVLLFIASIVSGVLFATKGFWDYSNQDMDIYSFDEEFSQSRYISSLLGEPESIILSVYYDVFYEEYDEMDYFVPKEDADSEELRVEFEKRIKNIYLSFLTKLLKV